MAPAENPLEIFRREYFGKIDQYLAWHDGYEANFACLDALLPAGQIQAAAELLAGLRAQTADARAVMGLGHLRCEEAQPLLHDYLRRGAYSRLNEHLQAFWLTYNHAKRLKRLRGLTPHEFVCVQWQKILLSSPKTRPSSPWNYTFPLHTRGG